jgi:hypothetical protein
MIVEPTHEELPRMEDLVLYLFLLDKIPQQYLQKVRSQKLVFLVKYKAWRQNKMLFHMKFTKQDMGPVSQHLYDILKIGTDLNLINLQVAPYFNRTAFNYSLSAKGSYFLDEISELIKENEVVFEIIKSVIAEYGNVTNGRELANKYVYPLKIGDVTVEQMQIGYKIDMPIPKSGYEFSLSKEWQETIKLLLDDKFQQELKIMVEEAPKYKSIPFEPL